LGFYVSYNERIGGVMDYSLIVAVGSLAGIIGVFFKLGKFQGKVEERFNGVDEKFEKMDKKIDTLKMDMDKKIDTLKMDMDKKIDTLKMDMDKKIDKIESNITLIRVDISDIQGRLAYIEGALFFRQISPLEPTIINPVAPKTVGHQKDPERVARGKKAYLTRKKKEEKESK
jgi:hypothetical protein